MSGNEWESPPDNRRNAASNTPCLRRSLSYESCEAVLQLSSEKRSADAIARLDKVLNSSPAVPAIETSAPITKRSTEVTLPVALTLVGNGLSTPVQFANNLERESQYPSALMQSLSLDTSDNDEEEDIAKFEAMLAKAAFGEADSDVLDFLLEPDKSSLKRPCLVANLSGDTSNSSGASRSPPPCLRRTRSFESSDAILQLSSEEGASTAFSRWDQALSISPTPALVCSKRLTPTESDPKEHISSGTVCNGFTHPSCPSALVQLAQASNSPRSIFAAQVSVQPICRSSRSLSLDALSGADDEKEFAAQLAKFEEIFAGTSPGDSTRDSTGRPISPQESQLSAAEFKAQTDPDVPVNVLPSKDSSKVTSDFGEPSQIPSMSCLRRTRSFESSDAILQLSSEEGSVAALSRWNNALSSPHAGPSCEGSDSDSREVENVAGITVRKAWETDEAAEATHGVCSQSTRLLPRVNFKFTESRVLNHSFDMTELLEGDSASESEPERESPDDVWMAVASCSTNYDETPHRNVLPYENVVLNRTGTLYESACMHESKSLNQNVDHPVNPALYDRGEETNFSAQLEKPENAVRNFVEADADADAYADAGSAAGAVADADVDAGADAGADADVDVDVDTASVLAEAEKLEMSLKSSISVEIEAFIANMEAISMVRDRIVERQEFLRNYQDASSSLVGDDNDDNPAATKSNGATALENGNQPLCYDGCRPLQPSGSGSKDEKELYDALKHDLHRASKCTPVGINSVLPPELLTYIFSFLSPFELGMCVAPVCRQWREAYESPSLWHSVDFSTQYDLTSNWVGYVCARHATAVRSVSLYGRGLRTEHELIAIALRCRHLVEVDVGYGMLGVKAADSLAVKCPSLRVLRLEGCEGVSGSALEVLCEKALDLSVLDLSHCGLATEDLLTLARSALLLEEVNIDGNSYASESSVREFLVRHAPTLRRLSLDGADLTNRAIEPLQSAPCMTHFSVSYPEECTDLALDYVKSMRKLKQLHWRRGKELSPLSLSGLFTGDDCLSGLTVVDLSECTKMENDTVQLLCNCCEELTHLHLRWCWNLTEVALAAIATTLRKLKVLDLVGVCNLTGHSFKKHPNCLPFLTLLDLTQCNNIDDVVIREFALGRLTLRTLDYYGDSFLA